ncbi:uncharacterized protein LOC120352052 [Nilaparvata lugens]|uniref:uncharacterized protein LOC120352052 n=1 Tax=Nilaparvata lugens TaxID=108931 RepID=UPI00193EB82E|nr:uncharacterized protein LOC120352052 [Nilaparvata lugens]
MVHTDSKNSRQVVTTSEFIGQGKKGVKNSLQILNWGIKGVVLQGVGHCVFDSRAVSTCVYHQYVCVILVYWFWITFIFINIKNEQSCTMSANSKLSGRVCCPGGGIQIPTHDPILQ